MGLGLGVERRREQVIGRLEQFQLSVRNVTTHHRGTEDTEEARRFEGYSTLCAPFVFSVPLW